MHSQSCKKTFVHSESVLKHHPWKYDKTVQPEKCTPSSSVYPPVLYMHCVLMFTCA